MDEREGRDYLPQFKRDRKVLEKLSKFTHLKELKLQLEKDKNVTDFDPSCLPKGLEVLTLEGKVGPLDNTFFDRIRTQCPEIKVIRLWLHDVTPPMITTLFPYEEYIIGIKLKGSGDMKLNDSILQELGKFSRLEELSLNLRHSSDPITPNGLEYFPKDLKSLTFRHDPTQINDAYLEAIAKQFPHLREIGVVHSAEGHAKQGPWYINISDHGLKALVNGCRGLITISLSESRITDEGIRYLSEHCPNLQSLDILCCQNLTTDSIGSLIKLNRLQHLVWSNALFSRSFQTFYTREAVKKYLENLNQ